jgi:hypothetical protein
MRLLKNLRVRFAKNPIRSGNYECNNTERNPESPKPNGMPAQLRFCASDLFQLKTALVRLAHNKQASDCRHSYLRSGISLCNVGIRGSGVLSGKRESDFAASTVPSYCGGPTRKSLRDCRPIATQRCPKSDSPKATRSGTRKQRPAPGVCLYSYILSCTRDCSTGKI